MNPLRGISILLMVCGAVSCKPRESVIRHSTDKPPRDELAAVDESSQATEVTLRKRLATKPVSLRAVDVDAFRAELLEVAKAKGKSPMSVVAPLMMEDEHDVRRLTLVLDAFNETEMQMDLVTRLPAIGTSRRIVVQLLIQKFESAKDTQGLGQLYSSLSPGADRSDVGAVRAEMAIRESGLAAGLDVIRNLEKPSERYQAVIKTKDVWAPRVREPEIKSKLDEIAASIISPMDYQFRENISLMVENALRKN